MAGGIVGSGPGSFDGSLRTEAVEFLRADEENVPRRTRSPIAQVPVETGGAVAGEDCGAGVVLLRGEQVAGAGEAAQVVQAHDHTPLGFAERQDTTRGVRCWGGEDRHVHFDLRTLSRVVYGAVANLGGKFAEQPSASQGDKGAADRFEMRSRDLGAKRALGRRPN